MNNKKGGFGAKLLLVIILMIASAVGGAYGYRVVDGKMAQREAIKAIENVDISDYDTAEQGTIQGYVDTFDWELPSRIFVFGGDFAYPFNDCRRYR